MADCSKTTVFFKEWHRLCDTFPVGKGDKCPLKINGVTRLCCNCGSQVYENIKKAGEIVQKWSDENPEIKRCAHCGDVAKLFWDHGYRFVSCDGCGIRTGNYDTAAYAIDVWNKRAGVADE